MIYRVYVTDRLYKDRDNLFIPAKDRFYDIIHPEKVNRLSGDEIALEVIKNAGLVVIK